MTGGASRPLREARYDLVELGEEFGPLVELVDDHKVKRFAFMMDDYLPWSFGESPFGGRIGHAGILANDLLQLFTQVYDPNTVVGLHTQEELWFHHPVRVKEQARLQGRYVDKYERRGQGHVVMEAEARGEDGRLLLRHRGIEIMRVQPGAVAGRGTAEAPAERVTGEYRRHAEPVAQASAGIPPGTPLRSLSKRVMQDQIAVFSGVGRHVRNIHTDIEVARRGGLRDTLAQGMMEFIHVTELLTGFFGPSWFTTGWQKMKFLRPVFAGEALTVRGVVTGEERVADGRRLLLEVWVENARGEFTAAGWASGGV